MHSKLNIEELQSLYDELQLRLSANSVVLSERSGAGYKVAMSGKRQVLNLVDEQAIFECRICQHIHTMDYPLFIDDVQSHPLLKGDPLVTKSGLGAFVGYPIHDGNQKVIAIFSVFHDRIHNWTRAEITQIETVAEETQKAVSGI